MRLRLPRGCQRRDTVEHGVLARRGKRKPARLQPRATQCGGLEARMVIGTAADLKMHIETLDVLPERGPQFIDLTELIEQVLQRSGVQNGMVVVFCRHTTAAIKINEN